MVDYTGYGYWKPTVLSITDIILYLEHRIWRKLHASHRTVNCREWQVEIKRTHSAAARLGEQWGLCRIPAAAVTYGIFLQVDLGIVQQKGWHKYG